MEDKYMKIKELKSKGLKKQFQVTVPAEDLEKEIDARISAVSKNTKIPGFRPGKAPKEMLKQKYRASVLGEAIDVIVRKETDALVKEKDLKPAMMPDIKVTKFEDGKDMEFEVSLEVLPEFKLNDFSKITLEKVVADVPAEEVDKALGYLADAKKETVKVEKKRASKKGDVLVIDFTGSVDGVEFKGGKGNDYPLELGSNTFIPGFEDQLIGKKPGDKVDVKVKFPKEYHAKDLADKDAVFAVEVKELRENKKVEVNDEFAKSLGETDLNALKEKISSRIKEDYESASKMKLKRSLLDVLDKEYGFEVPEGLVNAEYDGICKQYEQAKKYNQLDEEEKKKKESDLLKEYKDIAVRRVKLGLLLSEVAKEHQIVIAPDDINKAIMAEAKKYPGQEKAVFDYYLKNKQAVEALKAPVFEEKIIDYILSVVKMKENKVSVEELYNFDENPKPSKKKATKAK